MLRQPFPFKGAYWPIVMINALFVCEKETELKKRMMINRILFMELI
jgi:hypothetical protein